jgi:hypothetical protein
MVMAQPTLQAARTPRVSGHHRDLRACLRARAIAKRSDVRIVAMPATRELVALGTTPGVGGIADPGTHFAA